MWNWKSDEDKSLPVIESTVTSLKNGGEVFGFMFDKTNTKTWWYTPEYTVGEGNHRRIKDGHLPDSKDIKDFTNYELT